MKFSDLGFEKVTVTAGGQPGWYQKSTGKLLTRSEMIALVFKKKKEEKLLRNVTRPL